MMEPEPESFHRAGLAALQAGGRLDEAIGALRNALVLSPGHADATLDLAIALRGKRRFDASAALCRRAHALQPAWSDALYHLGRAHLATGRVGAAAGALRCALATDPSMATAWQWLGQARRQSGGPPAGTRPAFRHAAILEPGAFERWTALADFEAEHGFRGLALAAARKLPVLAPDDARVWLVLSRETERNDGMAAALPFAERTLRLAPALPDGRQHRTHLLFHLGQHRDAAASCITLLRLLDGAEADRSLMLWALWMLGECAMRVGIDVRLLPDAPFADMAERLLSLPRCPARPVAARAVLDRAGKNSGSETVSLFLRAILGRQLADAGWTPDEVEQAGILPIRDCARFLDDGTLSASSRNALLPALGYSVVSSRVWNGWIFERLVRPAIERAVERRDIDMAHRLVTFTQWSFMVQPHTYEQARLCYERIAPPFRALGHRLRTELGLPPATPGHGIAFFMNTVETDPPFHLERAMNILLRNAGSWRERFGPIHLVAIDDVSDRFRDAYASIGVTVTTPERCPPTGPDRILRLALRVRELGLAGVVFLNCVEGLVDLFAGMGVAPVQLFMSADFFHIDSPDLDGLLTFGALGKWTNTIGGRVWRSVPFPFAYSALPPGPAKADLERRARDIRRDLLDRFDIILGSIGRPEKLSSEFLEVVARLLHANPKACFLWFGHQELPAVRQVMEQQGISDRCLFQGWVDTRLYAKVLDIHLDSFPFPTGVTMVEVMLAGCPQVWMSSAAADQLSIGGSIERLMSGMAGTAEEQELCRRIFSREGPVERVPAEPLFLFSTRLDEYCGMAQRLIDDPAYRARLGQAGRAFAEHFVLDVTRGPNALFGHIADVIEGKAQ